MKKVYVREIPSVIGPLKIASCDEGLCAIFFDSDQNYAQWLYRYFDVIEPSNDQHTTVINQLNDYFEGKLKKFDLGLVLLGTEFQKKVWNELLNIEYGETSTYGQIARSIGNPKASRGVGGAVGKNPIPVIIPCHRVIGSDDSLTGFSGGIDKKIKLLEIEGLQIPKNKVMKTK